MWVIPNKWRPSLGPDFIHKSPKFVGGQWWVMIALVAVGENVPLEYENDRFYKSTTFDDLVGSIPFLSYENWGDGHCVSACAWQQMLLKNTGHRKQKKPSWLPLTFSTVSSLHWYNHRGTNTDWKCRCCGIYHCFMETNKTELHLLAVYKSWWSLGPWSCNVGDLPSGTSLTCWSAWIL